MQRLYLIKFKPSHLNLIQTFILNKRKLFFKVILVIKQKFSSQSEIFFNR